MNKLSHGWTGKVLEMDLGTREINIRKLPQEFYSKFIGQSGINAALLYQMAPPEIGPLDPQAPFIFGVGPLAGTPAPCSGRFSVTFKSPLTGIFADSNCGGHFGPELKMAGFDHVIITGKSESPVYLLIDNHNVRIEDAADIWGLDTAATEEEIKTREMDRTLQIAGIGPAGENLVRFAAVISNCSRAAARCGPGAVLGSKNLKAVAVRGHLGLKTWDPEGFEKACLQAKQAIQDDPLYSQASTYGTACITGMAQALGFLPTRNFRESTFEGAPNLFGDAIYENHLERHKGCYNCPVSCSKYCSVTQGDYQGTAGEGPEYESISAFGPKCGNDNLASILHSNMLCNQLGLDTISAGNTLAWAMECFEQGILTREDIGTDLNFGNHQAINTLLHRIARREGIGDILAEGAPLASSTLGGSEYVVHSKGMDYPAVDVRGTKGMALSFAVSPRGGDHLKGLPMFEIAPDVYAEEIKRELGINPPDSYWLHYSGKPELIRWHEDWHCVVDSLGLCKLEGIAIKPLYPEHFLQLLQTATGLDISLDELRKAGERIWNLERRFNAREGLDSKSDLPPRRLLQEPISSGPSRGEVLDKQDFLQMLQEYYRQRGWDQETGIPCREKLQELQLSLESEIEAPLQVAPAK